MLVSHFYDALDACFNGMKVDDIVSFLEDVKNEDLLEGYVEERLEGRAQCESCGFINNHHEAKFVVEERERITSYDGEKCVVKELVSYMICPYCGQKTYFRTVKLLSVEEY